MNTTSVAETNARRDTFTMPAKRPAAQNPVTVTPQSKEGDALTLSPEARKKLTEQKRQEEAANVAKAMKEEMERSDESIKAFAETTVTAGKCMTIAGRIMAGDHVPQADERFLAKNDSELYMMAIMMRRMKEDPQKYRSIVGDAPGDDKPITVSEGTAETPETPPTAEGGESTEGGGEGESAER